MSQQVACVHCSALIDLAQADVTGRGYRCSPCSMKASLAADGGINDIGDHLTPEERVARGKAASTEMAFGGIVAAAGAVVFLSVSGLLGMIVLCGGLGMTSHGFLTRREMTGQRTS